MVGILSYFLALNPRFGKPPPSAFCGLGFSAAEALPVGETWGCKGKQNHGSFGHSA
jgi:hypothetical protein